MRFVREVEAFTKAKVQTDEPMKNHTTFGIGGNADYFVEADGIYTLREIISIAEDNKIPYKVIGNGSKLLASDKGVRGAVIALKKNGGFFIKDGEIRANAGENLGGLISFAADNGFCGLEFLSGIPATVGGAIVMNAGAFGKSVSDCLVSVETLKKGKIRKYDADDCRFSYRSSRFRGGEETVVAASFKLINGEKEKSENRSAFYISARRRIQPEGKSCGSIFVNPKGDYAGRLIEAVGLKGFSIGEAAVSARHANFIVNEGEASAKDVLSLIAYIKRKVFRQYGITLQEEVETIGEF